MIREKTEIESHKICEIREYMVKIFYCIVNEHNFTVLLNKNKIVFFDNNVK